MTLHPLSLSAPLYLFSAPMDFTRTTASLTFTDSNTKLCRNVTIQDDIIIEEEQEQFGLMLSTSDSAVQFSRETASATIRDNDSMYIRD